MVLESPVKKLRLGMEASKLILYSFLIDVWDPKKIAIIPVNLECD